MDSRSSRSSRPSSTRTASCCSPCSTFSADSAFRKRVSSALSCACSIVSVFSGTAIFSATRASSRSFSRATWPTPEDRRSEMPLSTSARILAVAASCCARMLSYTVASRVWSALRTGSTASSTARVSAVVLLTVASAPLTSAVCSGMCPSNTALAACNSLASFASVFCSALRCSRARPACAATFSCSLPSKLPPVARSDASSRVSMASTAGDTLSRAVSSHSSRSWWSLNVSAVSASSSLPTRLCSTLRACSCAAYARTSASLICCRRSPSTLKSRCCSAVTSCSSARRSAPRAPRRQPSLDTFIITSRTFSSRSSSSVTLLRSIMRVSLARVPASAAAKLWRTRASSSSMPCRTVTCARALRAAASWNVVLNSTTSASTLALSLPIPDSSAATCFECCASRAACRACSCCTCAVAFWSRSDCRLASVAKSAATCCVSRLMRPRCLPSIAPNSCCTRAVTAESPAARSHLTEARITLRSSSSRATSAVMLPSIHACQLIPRAVAASQRARSFFTRASSARIRVSDLLNASSTSARTLVSGKVRTQR